MKKRVLSILLAAVMCLSLAPMTALADWWSDYEVGWYTDEDGYRFYVDAYGNIHWDLSSGPQTTTPAQSTTNNDFDIQNGILRRYTGPGGHVVIPSGVTGITGYHENGSYGTLHGAFANRSDVTSVTIPNGVTYISENSFLNCAGLTSITLPNSVALLYSRAFYGCTSLASITIPEGTVVYGEVVPTHTTVYGFSNSSAENFAKLNGNPFVSIGGTPTQTPTPTPTPLPTTGGMTETIVNRWEGSQPGHYGAETFTIENGVLLKFQLSGSPAMNHRYSGTTVIPDGVTSIGDRAFGGSMTYIETLIIPSSVTSIGAYAFSAGTKLTSITIPSGVTSIGERAFEGCTSLTSITIPSGVTSISAGAFNGCFKLASITMPSSVTSIEENAFGLCSSLTSITIPNSVTSIGKYAFEGCRGLTSLTIPGSVKSIDDCAFVDCSALTSLTLESGVTSIGAYAFSGCSNLTSAIIPESVTSIGEYAFSPMRSDFLTIYGVSGSYTESFAEGKGYNFAPIGGAVLTEKPSSWAADSVNAAITAGIVPQTLQAQYTQATTRVEFCALAVALYETATGREIQERARFNDTSDINVQKMGALGVVNGISEGIFAPDQKLTREQAATMLARLAAAIGKPLTGQRTTFTDSSRISTWAAEAVGQMQASGIMGGVGDNRFAPMDDYTREQSILTMLRLFDVAK